MDRFETFVITIYLYISIYLYIYIIILYIYVIYIYVHHDRSKRYFPGLLEYACAEFVFNFVFIFLKNYLPKILTTTKRKPECKSLKLPSSNPCVT